MQLIHLVRVSSAANYLVVRREIGTSWEVPLQVSEAEKEISTMAGGAPNRIVTFSEVMFVPYAWAVIGHPDNEGFVTYNHNPQTEPSTIAITRSDGKVLSFEVTEDYSVQMRDNIIKFSGREGLPSGEPFT